MFEELNAHRQGVEEQIQKGFEIGFTENSISKAHKEGDIHPNGKWVWTRLPSGRYDWRVIKKQDVSDNRAVWDYSKNKFDNKEEVGEFLFSEFKKIGGAGYLDEEQTKKLVSSFQKRYGFNSFSEAEKVLKGVAYNGTKKYSIDFLTQFGQYHFAIDERPNFESSGDKFTREELRKDYDSAEWADNSEKKALASKYGIQSLKKADIQKEILNQLREVRKTATSFDIEDVRDFFRLEPGVVKIKDYLKEEGIEFVKYLKTHEEEYLKKHKLDKWIGFPVSSGVPLSYADKDKLKRYAKITEYLVEAEPRPRTAKDEEFDRLVHKFTDLLADYKKEYLNRVKDYARERYNKTLPDKLKSLRDHYVDLKAEGGKLDWRTDRVAYDKNYDARRKTANQIDAIEKFFKKYAKLTDYVQDCEKNASDEFQDNIKTLSDRIMREELDTDKMTVKSVHDDPKVFNMKITDGTKNLYCRSILAAMFSSYMIPHYRFIITNRKDGND